MVDQPKPSLNSLGGLSSVSASRSVATIVNAPAAWAAANKASKSCSEPVVSGYCTSTPKQWLSIGKVRWSPTTTSMPSGCARVRTMSIVCGWHFSETKNVRWAEASPSLSRWHIIIASAAAVPSSSIEALAISRPVISVTSVWKFSSASSRPWEISA